MPVTGVSLSVISSKGEYRVGNEHRETVRGDEGLTVTWAFKPIIIINPRKSR